MSFSQFGWFDYFLVKILRIFLHRRYYRLCRHPWDRGELLSFTKDRWEGNQFLPVWLLDAFQQKSFRDIK